jgi:hypothetical protein
MAIFMVHANKVSLRRILAWLGVLAVPLLLLLQSALQPLWVLACSTIVEYSQQEGFLSGTSDVAN